MERGLQFGSIDGNSRAQRQQERNSKKGYTHDSSKPTSLAPKATSNWSMAAVGPGTPNQQPLRCPHPHHLAFTVAEPANLVTDKEELPV